MQKIPQFRYTSVLVSLALHLVGGVLLIPMQAKQHPQQPAESVVIEIVALPHEAEVHTVASTEPAREIEEQNIPLSQFGSLQVAPKEIASVEGEKDERYEQVIARYIQRVTHLIASENYQGVVWLWVSIDKNGRIIKHKLESEESAPQLQNAFNNIMQDLGPMPPLPPEYGAAGSAEFIIPIQFN